MSTGADITAGSSVKFSVLYLNNFVFKTVKQRAVSEVEVDEKILMMKLMEDTEHKLKVKK